MLVLTDNNEGATLKRLFTMFAMILAVGCGPANDTSISDEVDGPSVVDDVSVVSSALACESDRNCNNCVYYAGCRSAKFKQLPVNLTTWDSKKSIINSDSGAPGCVAIIKSGTLGHVAYVTKVTHNPHRVWIEEGNWGGRCNSRNETKSALNIVGYWCP
ncbi:CHAP domain-containing protein [Cystobacter fuscus]|uniref:CHAP domain-containing protein n=1 Tax=Cystobacter fuscus TaxID=43 RepID=UPI002B2ED663|nr:CHAP domain-containing protein [Cystobacter fuscus]